MCIFVLKSKDMQIQLHKILDVDTTLWGNMPKTEMEHMKSTATPKKVLDGIPYGLYLDLGSDHIEGSVKKTTMLCRVF